LHRNYPHNRAALTGKQAAAAPFQSPVEIPELAAKYKRELDWEGKLVQSCVHCHQIGDALRSFHRAQKKPVPSDLIYPMPPPETIGLTLAADQRARVAAVAPGTPAATAAIRPGDDLVSVNGQPIISVADVAWALHRGPETGSLPLVVRRHGTEHTLRVDLPAGWRTQSDISRRVGTWQMRAMTSGGLVLEDLSDDERRRRGLSLDSLALLVKSVGQYGKHAAARNAGFKKDDVLIEFAGLAERLTEGQLIGRLLQNYPAGTRVRVMARRGEETVTLTMPMQ
jgi:membrane-associated protease RseP (regulator of RpoE activity)